MKAEAHRFPIEGSSALQPDVQPALECDKIIAFPGSRTIDTEDVLDPYSSATAKHARVAIDPSAHYGKHSAHNALLEDTRLRRGSLSGTPLPNFTTAHEIVGVVAFAIFCAFMVLI